MNINVQGQEYKSEWCGDALENLQAVMPKEGQDITGLFKQLVGAGVSVKDIAFSPLDPPFAFAILPQGCLKKDEERSIKLEKDGHVIRYDSGLSVGGYIFKPVSPFVCK